jgi:hypothetical protein
MRISMHVRQLVMNAMARYPVQWTAFERDRSAHGERVLQQLWNLVTAMRQQPVVPHTDSQAHADEPQNHRNPKCTPGKEEKRGNRTHMKKAHEEKVEPVQRASLPFAAERMRLRSDPLAIELSSHNRLRLGIINTFGTIGARSTGISNMQAGIQFCNWYSTHFVILLSY